MGDEVKEIVLPPKPEKPLSWREQRFVDLYAGNAGKAMREAGYHGGDAELSQAGSRMLKRKRVRDAIRRRDEEERNARIATRQERQSFWTDIMKDPEQDIAARLKASELLGKSQADFVERVEQESTITVEIRTYKDE